MDGVSLVAGRLQVRLEAMGTGHKASRKTRTYGVFICLEIGTVFPGMSHWFLSLFELRATVIHRGHLSKWRCARRIFAQCL